MNANCYHSQQDMEFLLFHSSMKLQLATLLPQFIKDQSKLYHVNKIIHKKITSYMRSEKEHRYKNIKWAV